MPPPLLLNQRIHPLRLITGLMLIPKLIISLKRQENNLISQRKQIHPWSIKGVTLLELLIAMVIMAGLLLVDIQIQKNNSIALKKQQTDSSIVNLKDSLISLLRQHWTLETSMIASNNAALLATAPSIANILNREAVSIVDPGLLTPDPNMISTIATRNVSDPSNPRIFLHQETITENGTDIHLIGYNDPNYPNNLKSIDNGAGWVYIRSMWIQDFVPIEMFPAINTNSDSANSTDFARGAVSLKIIIWKYTNLIDRPRLNCLAENNCERVILTIPATVTLVTATTEPGVTRRTAFENPSTINPTDDGSGTTCSSRTLTITNTERFGCRENEYYMLEEFVQAGDTSTKESTLSCLGATRGCWVGRCCQYLVAN